MGSGDDSSPIEGPQTAYVRPVSEWVEPTCTIASVWQTSGASLLELFRSAEPALADRRTFIEAVVDWLGTHMHVIEQWSAYSDDKRTSPSPYFHRPQDGHTVCEVGFFDAGDGRMDVRQHSDAAMACADFLYREATWVLRRERVM